MRFAYSNLSIAIFSVFSPIVLAATPANNTSVSLSTIISEAKQDSAVGTTVYSAEQLKNMPNGKKTIADFLKNNSNVQFERDALGSGNQASLAPEKISINGAQFYDNKFVVNGVNTSNTFDPVGDSADTTFTGVPSQSQTANINTDLLCELEVIDSNASAEHGEFLGGVISAKTCTPKTEIGKIHGSVSADYTSSAWSRFNFIDTEEEFESNKLDNISSQQYHREYDIYGLSATAYGRLNEKWGVSLNTSLRNSKIPVLSGYSDEKVDTEENNNSIGITTYFTPHNKAKYQFGFDHFDYNRDGYLSKIIRSDYSIDTITDTFFIQSEHLFDQFKLENNLNYRTTDSERLLDQDYSAAWAYSLGDKDWLPGSSTGDTLTEGGSGGDLLNQQSTLSYDIKATFNPFKFAQSSHQFKIGAGYKHNEGTWDRPSDSVTYTGTGYIRVIDSKTGKYVNTTTPQRGNLGDALCAAGDYLCSNTALAYKPASKDPEWQQWNGQYFKKGILYSTAKLSARQDQWFSFIEDQITFKNLKARFGVRADYDSLASNLNIAPRSSIEYTPFGNQALKLTGGYNRYYGSTYLVTELQEKQNTFKFNLSRDDEYDSHWNASNNFGWQIESEAGTLGTKATDLDTPYSDEIMFGLNGDVANLQWGLKWVNRDFKNTIRQNAQLKSFENIDSGKADTYTITLANTLPYSLLGTLHTFNLGLSYIEDNTYISTYRDTNSLNMDKWAYADGNLYQVGSLPTKDSPFTARFNWLIQSPDATWAWNNFFNYRSGSTNYTKTKNLISIDGIEATIYELEDFPSKFTWDTRATYNLKSTANQALTFGLTVSNVLNKKNQVVTTDNKVFSEEGRRFIADITFKF
ncbi:MAG: TonB-dependent receptor plug domain-containing protein [Candidatus Acinetobacter avistercoris]|uniref:TonB-dependent receptor plug domain-containing protein n=1 Tax=Acinetobacter sp. KS-LM10 TaxID=3120518 RepID=UPI001F864C23|nr:TonB-dependent receptor plug domain-containing protein [Candidatus Acinetobacter avistercoris]